MNGWWVKLRGATAPSLATVLGITSAAQRQGPLNLALGQFNRLHVLETAQKHQLKPANYALGDKVP